MRSWVQCCNACGVANGQPAQPMGGQTKPLWVTSHHINTQPQPQQITNQSLSRKMPCECIMSNSAPNLFKDQESLSAHILLPAVLRPILDKAHVHGRLHLTAAAAGTHQMLLLLTLP